MSNISKFTPKIRNLYLVTLTADWEICSVFGRLLHNLGQLAYYMDVVVKCLVQEHNIMIQRPEFKLGLLNQGSSTLIIRLPLLSWMASIRRWSHTVLLRGLIQTSSQRECPTLGVFLFKSKFFVCQIYTNVDIYIMYLLKYEQSSCQIDLRFQSDDEAILFLVSSG